MFKKTLFTLIVLFITVSIIFFNGPNLSWSKNKKNVNILSAQQICIQNSYAYFKKHFLTSDGRVMDPERSDITVSEAQGYMLQRTTVMNDRKTFDIVYKWTKNHLQRKDKLYSWEWGKNKSGKYVILDYNSASDADVDIALALCFAYVKWKGNYIQEARLLIESIWNNETRKIGKYRVLMPGVEQTKSNFIEVNPSYFYPYAFKFFKKYDKKHNWEKLNQSSYYYVLQACSKTKTGLPPNWFLIQKGQVILEDSERSDFSYDAIRVFMRFYIDYLRTGDKRDLPILAKSKFFINKWIKTKHIYTNYIANGTLRDSNEFVGSIVILIPIISLYNKNVADEIYKKKVLPYFYDPKQWSLRKDYYAKNLLWYGCHFYHKGSNEWKGMLKVSKELSK